jgi:predicted  nucleic acid-binding Zn-ribbon protein
MKGTAMKGSLSIPLTLLLAFVSANLPAQTASSESGQPQPNAQVQPQSTAQQEIPANEALPSTAQTTSVQTPDEVRKSQRDHYRACDQSLGQARNTARTLSHDASQMIFDTNALRGQHQQIQEKLSSVKDSREELIAGLTVEQQGLVQDHTQSMQQIHDRIQSRLQDIDKEFTGPSLNLATVSDHARAVERDIKLYQKHLQQTGKALNLLND